MLTVEVLERFPEARERWQQGLPLRPRRRVPGHEPRAVPAAAAAGGRSTGTSARSATRTSRSTRSAAPTSATSSSSSATSPGRRPIALEQNYRSTNTILHAANARHRATTASASRRTSGRSSARASRCACSRSRTSTPRRASSPPRSPRLVEEGFGGSEIAVFYRTNAQSRVLEDVLVRQGVAVPGDRRPALLRARRGQGRDRLPAGDRQPGRRRLAACGSPTGRGAGSATRRSRGCRPTPTRTGSRSGRRSATRRRRASAAAPLKAVQRLHDAAAVARGRRVAGAVGRRAGRARARAQRLPRGARGRADDRGAGPDREPAGARRRRAGVPSTPPRSRSLSGFLQEISLFSDQDALRERAEPRHADDAPQREGARVPRRLHDRDGGGDLPARALDRGAGARGGAAARLRRHDARRRSG